MVYFHTFSVLQTAGWWQPQWFWGWHRDHLVSSYSAAAVSPCAPDQTEDRERSWVCISYHAGSRDVVDVVPPRNKQSVQKAQNST